MRPTHRLTHLALRYRSPSNYQSTSLRRIAHTLQCGTSTCMSPARSVTTTPEGTKRRRLSGPIEPPLRKRAYSNMSPMLVQEIEEDVAPPQKLELTDVEATFRRLLLDVAKYIDGSPVSASVDSQVTLPDSLATQPLVLRWTGGWVRDKLLGVQSHDIDVAINKMTGYQFGLRMKEYLEIPGNLEKYGLESIAANEKQSQKAGTTDKSKTVGGLHKIEANPEKSKHLETTTVRILGLDVDLVNLRKETYSDDSRNPQMEFGTPEEDALRRDATVNAMFYNINTEQIEDFTGRGHEDMAAKIIRTPLEPYQTFKDDPLRVLRLIRFASRLGYTVEPGALEAMSNADIKDALRKKISRERVGTELEKALLGPDPHEALRLVFSLDLYETIFSDPALANADHYTPDTAGWEVVIEATKEIIDEGDVLQENLARDKDEQFLAWQLAGLVPYRDAPLPDPPASNKKAPPPIAVQVAREGVKATNKTTDVILSSVRNQSEISTIVDKVYQQKRRPDKKIDGEDVAARDVLGMAIRRWGTSWRSQVFYALLVDVANDPDQVDPIRTRYTTFVAHLISLDLLNVTTLKPLLDGKALAKALDTPPGPWMKDALDVVMAWQLRHPDITDPEQAIEEVKHQRQRDSKGELKHDLIRHFLKLTIRPLFIKAKTDNVTEQGRKPVAKAMPKKIRLGGEDESITRPWKTEKDAYVLDILRWTVNALDETIIAESWRLIVPPILTLLDDWETRYKALGCTHLDALLQNTPADALRRTGLDEVFEEALMPCLTYLPPITPETEAVALLDAVFPALLTLSQIRFPTKMAAEVHVHPEERRKFLDKIIRRGVTYGYSHCSSYPSITTILFNHLTSLLNELKIDSVKHIKFILPTITETLSHPLSNTSPQLLDSALDALRSLILNCWPRMHIYRAEVLKGVAFLWLRTEDKQLRRKARSIVSLLEVAVRRECDFWQEVEGLIVADERLKGLFNNKS